MHWRGSYHALLALRFFDGLALGGMLPLAWALNIEFVPSRMRSTVVTVIMMGYSLGAAIAGPMTNWVAPHHGWQGVYLAGGIGYAVMRRGAVDRAARVDPLPGAQGRTAGPLVRRLLTPDRSDASMFSPADHFVLSDELTPDRNFRVGQLFRGDLRLITPMLWLGYFASSLAIYFCGVVGSDRGRGAAVPAPHFGTGRIHRQPAGRAWPDCC